MLNCSSGKFLITHITTRLLLIVIPTIVPTSSACFKAIRWSWQVSVRSRMLFAVERTESRVHSMAQKFNIALNCVTEIWKKRSFISVSIKWDNGTSGWRARECWGQMMCRLLFNDISMMTLNVLLCHYSLGRHRLLNRTIYRLRQMSFHSPDVFIENTNEHKTFVSARNCSSSITRMLEKWRPTRWNSSTSGLETTINYNEIN